ncbi:MAG TPA: hypothetical protein VF739_04795 [Ktedonobacterales bacterium]
MNAVQLFITGASGLALLGLAPRLAQAWRRGARYGRLCALCAIVSAALLVATLIALALGADRSDTGRFLMGMGVGVAVGLMFGCGGLLIVGQRKG